jgi:hypothetical protein
VVEQVQVQVDGNLQGNIHRVLDVVPGLRTPHTRYFVPVPVEAQHVACNNVKRSAMGRAFAQNGYQVIQLGSRRRRKNTSRKNPDLHLSNATATVTLALASPLPSLAKDTQRCMSQGQGHLLYLRSRAPWKDAL